MMRTASKKVYQPPHLRLVQAEIENNSVCGAKPGAVGEDFSGIPKEIKAIIFCGVLMVLVAVIDLVRMVAKPPKSKVARYDSTTPEAIAKEPMPVDFPTSMAAIPLLNRMFCVGLSVPQFCLEEPKDHVRAVPLSKTSQSGK